MFRTLTIATLAVATVSTAAMAKDTLYIVNVSVRLDNSATITAFITNEEGMGIQHQLEMDSETYAGWGNDDEYVVNWVLTELGLERA